MRLRSWAAAALVAFAVAMVAAWAQWGTGWTVPSEGDRAGYTLVAYWDGAGLPAGAFQHPIGVAVGPRGDVYVSDALRRVVRLASAGAFLGQWAREGSGPGEFGNPVGIAVAPDGSVLVCDYDQDRIQRFTAEGAFLHAFGSSGSGPGQLDSPAGLGVDAGGNVYVADFYNHRVQRFGPTGALQRVIGRAGRLGPGALHYPTGVALTREGRVLVADAYNYRLQWFDPEGRPLKRVGSHLFWLWPRPTAGAGFNVPTDAAVAPDGTIHVADSGNHRIVMLSSQGRRLGEWRIPDAPPEVYSPEHIAVSPDGQTVYATDLAANRVLVLRVSRGGRP